MRHKKANCKFLVIPCLILVIHPFEVYGRMGSEKVGYPPTDLEKVASSVGPQEDDHSWVRDGNGCTWNESICYEEDNGTLECNYKPDYEQKLPCHCFSHEPQVGILLEEKSLKTNIHGVQEKGSMRPLLQEGMKCNFENERISRVVSGLVNSYHTISDNLSLSLEKLEPSDEEFCDAHKLLACTEDECKCVEGPAVRFDRDGFVSKESGCCYSSSGKKYGGHCANDTIILFPRAKEKTVTRSHYTHDSTEGYYEENNVCNLLDQTAEAFTNNCIVNEATITKTAVTTKGDKTTITTSTMTTISKTAATTTGSKTTITTITTTTITIITEETKTISTNITTTTTEIVCFGERCSEKRQRTEQGGILMGSSNTVDYFLIVTLSFAIILLIICVCKLP